jgi:hypothetical protein
MWKTLLTNITSLAGGIYIYLIVAAASAAVTGYAAYSWTSDYYVAKIEKSNLEAEQKVNDIQRKGDQLVADYIQKIEQLGSVNASLQQQISVAVHPSNNGTCTIDNGFIRLYNASATGQTSSPSGADGAPTSLDLATVLSVAADNNAKYLKIAEQLKELQAYENAK